MTVDRRHQNGHGSRGKVEATAPVDGEATAGRMQRRWRLIMGGLAERALGNRPLGPRDVAMQTALDYLYSRAYGQRGIQLSAGRRGAGSASGLPTVLDWLKQLPGLFPDDVCDTIRHDALDRFELNEMLTDAQTLQEMTPSQGLLESLLMLKGKMTAEVLEQLRRIIAVVVADITRRLRREIHTAFGGRRNRFRRSPLKIAGNFDWRRTIRANLKHYDANRQRLVIDQLYFNSRIKHRLPWDVMLVVDQSGSMASSVIHSAVMAGILGALPGVNVRLMVFDTRVVDLTHQVHDPVELLMTVQLGGGTDIGKAMAYCEQCITNPHRTVVALISDFYEGGSERRLLATVRRLTESRVTLLGLAALGDDGAPDFDRAMAERLAAFGMHVGAMTPYRFAEWLAQVMDG